MAKPKFFREARQREARNRIPQVKLNDCRVQASAGIHGYQVILEGMPVAIGVVPPMIEVGGQKPLKLAFSRDAQIATGIIPAAPKTKEAIIDYGFTRDRCTIRRAGVRDRILYWRVTTDSCRRRGIIPTLERILALIVARLFLIRH